MKNIVFIDIAKGLGILLVICSHTCYPLMTWASLFYIPIFFVVSGYCTTREVRISEKLWKLIIPYFLFTLFALLLSKEITLNDIIGALYGRWSLYPYNNKENILFLQVGNGPLWFLPSMFTAFCYYKFAHTDTLHTNVITWFITYLIITYLLSFVPILLPWSLDTAPLFALFILEGVIIRKYSLMDKMSIPSIIVLVCLYAIFRYYTWSVNLSIRYYGRSLFLLFPGASIGCILTLFFAKMIETNRIAKILSEIGKKSLSIFCIHWPFIFISKDILRHINIDENTIFYNIIHILLILLITYPIALIIDTFLIKPIYSINPFKKSTNTFNQDNVKCN